MVNNVLTALPLIVVNIVEPQHRKWFASGIITNKHSTMKKLEFGKSYLLLVKETKGNNSKNTKKNCSD